MKNYYKILELDKNAEQLDIKANFRKLANKFHPDKNGGDLKCEEIFKNILEAYNILSNPIKKIEYDIKLNNFIEKKIEIKTNSYNYKRKINNIYEIRISKRLTLNIIITIVLIIILIFIADGIKQFNDLNKNFDGHKKMQKENSFKIQNNNDRPKSGELNFKK